VAVRVEVLGRVKLSVNGVEARCGHKSLMALLAVRFPKPVRRSEIVETLFPSVPRKEAMNRLRVGLSRLRSVLPVSVTDDAVQLALGEVEVDAWSVREQSRPSQPCSEVEEFESLYGLLAPLGLTLLSGVSEPWADAERLEWNLEAISTLLRLAELADKLHRWDVQLEAAMAGLEHIPHDEELWEHALVASARLGDPVTTLSDWAKARARLKEEGDDFSPEAVELAKTVRGHGGLAKAHFSSEEEALILRLVEHCANEDPGALRSLVCSPVFAMEAKRRPEAALKLLEAASEGPGRAEPSVIVARIATLGHLDRWPQALEEGERLLAGDMPQRDRLQLLSTLSFGSMFAGDLHLGLERLDELESLCREEAWEHDGWLARCTRASCLWMQTEFEESYALFQQCIAYLKSLRKKDVGVFLAVTQSNCASLLADMGRFRESLDLATVSDSQARKLGLADSACRAAATLSRVCFCLGRTQEALGHSRRAIRTAVRQSSVRLHVNTIENVGLGLLAGPSPTLGASLLQTGWNLRRAHSLPLQGLFLWRRTVFATEAASPLLVSDSQESLVQAYRCLRVFEETCNGRVTPQG